MSDAPPQPLTIRGTVNSIQVLSKQLIFFKVLVHKDATAPAQAVSTAAQPPVTQDSPPELVQLVCIAPTSTELSTQPQHDTQHSTEAQASTPMHFQLTNSEHFERLHIFIRLGDVIEATGTVEQSHNGPYRSLIIQHITLLSRFIDTNPMGHYQPVLFASGNTTASRAMPVTLPLTAATLPESQRSTGFCKFWLSAGKCKYETCSFLHVTGETLKQAKQEWVRKQSKHT